MLKIRPILIIICYSLRLVKNYTEGICCKFLPLIMTQLDHSWKRLILISLTWWIKMLRMLLSIWIKVLKLPKCNKILRSNNQKIFQECLSMANKHITKIKSICSKMIFQATIQLISPLFTRKYIAWKHLLSLFSNFPPSLHSETALIKPYY